MKARIVYQGGLTYNLGNRIFKKGVSEETRDEALVEQLSAISGFKITYLEKPSKKAAAVEVEEDEDEGEITDEEIDAAVAAAEVTEKPAKPKAGGNKAKAKA